MKSTVNKSISQNSCLEISLKNVLKNLKIVLLKLTIHTLTTFDVSGVAVVELLTLLFTFMV